MIGGVLVVVAAAIMFGFAGFGLALAFLIGILISWMIVLRPWLGVVVIAFVLPFERFGSVELSGFTFRASQLFLIVTLIAFFIHVFRGSVRLRFHGAYIPLLLLIVGMSIALPFSVNLFRGITTTFFILFTMSLVVVIPTLITSKQRLMVVLKSLLLGAIVTSAFGMFQFAGDLAGLPQEITGLRDLYTKEVFGFPRIQSTALEPLYYANYLLLPIALSIVVLIRKIRALLPYALVSLPLALPVFVLTVSRAAYIAGALMIVALGFVFLRRVMKPSYFVLIAVLGTLTFFGVTYALSLTGEEEVSIQTFTTHVTSLFAGASFADRATTNLQALEIVRNQPQGIGPGNFGPVIANHPHVEPRGGWLIVNNIYLEIWAEEGVLGILGYVAFLIVLFVAGIRMFLQQKNRGDSRYFLLAALAAAFAISVQYLTFSILYIMHIWFVFALCIAFLSVKNSTLYDT